MGIGFRGDHAAAGGAGEETRLHQEGLVYLFDGADVLGGDSGQGFQSDRTAGLFLDNSK